MVQAVICDLDGCLVDSEPLSLGAIAAQMRALGIADATAEEIGARFLGVGMATIRDYVSQRLGHDCPQHFARDVEARLFASYRIGLPRIDGTMEMLGSLRAHDIGLGIATGGSLLRMQTTLEIAGIARFFEGTACSVDEVARGKPAPDLFQLAAKRLGIEPECCIVLEDSPHGVEGAASIGMRTIGFVGGSHLEGRRDAHAEVLRQAGADLVLNRLDDVTDVVVNDTMVKRSQMKSRKKDY